MFVLTGGVAMNIAENDSLLVVDVQNDFCPGGALSVSEGHRVVAFLNAVMPRFGHVFFTRDWHPSDHCSFSSTPEFHDGSWPAHCVADTPGAQFHGDLHVPVDAVVVSKGCDPELEAYSGFEGTDLERRLHDKRVTRLFVGGLATDYCVRVTVLDALLKGFEVVVLENACRGVNMPMGSATEAVEEMRQAGALVISTKELG